MLDKIYITPHRTETQYVTREVHEHRAPTDESVKLLKEMEAAAEKKRTDAMRIEGNGFNCIVEFVQHMMDYSAEAVAVFDLNGVRKRISHRMPMDTERGKLLIGLRDEVAKALAGEMIMQGVR